MAKADTDKDRIESVEDKISVFLAWSGKASRKTAMVFKEYLPVLINALDPYVSTEDIQKGMIWRTEIAAQLEKTDCGILCVTPNNLHSEWMHFEAGALSKRVTETRVCTFMMGTTASDLGTSPLSNFQATAFDKNDFLRLIKTLNNLCGNLRSNEKTLEKVLDKFWDEISGKLDKIQKDIDKLTPKAKEAATPETKAAGQISPEVVDEVLSRLRGLERQQSQIINKIGASTEEALWKEADDNIADLLAHDKLRGERWSSLIMIIDQNLLAKGIKMTTTGRDGNKAYIALNRHPGADFIDWAYRLAYKRGFGLLIETPQETEEDA